MKSMKNSVCTFIVVVLLLGALRLFPAAPVRAHGSGPPYVKVNGEYALSNPILNIAQPAFFKVGADVASTSGYLVGKPVSFAVDEQFFPNPYRQAGSPFGLPVTNAPDVPQAQFRWDFQDGSPAVEGANVAHVFTKSGTYLVELSAKFEGKTQDYTIVNTIQVDILPTASYVRPSARIRVDGMDIGDPERDTADIKPMVPVSFDASSSEGEIVTYQWDFGDGKGGDKKTITHRYARDEYFPVAILRTTDRNGISTDTYALLNIPFEKPNAILRIWYAISDFVTGLFRR